MQLNVEEIRLTEAVRQKDWAVCSHAERVVSQLQNTILQHRHHS